MQASAPTTSATLGQPAELQHAPSRPPMRPWALRYSIRHRDGTMGGTVTIHLRRLPPGCSPLEAARAMLANRCPGATAVLPRAILLDDDA